MPTKHILWILLLVTACRKNDVTEPAFSVTTESATYQAGDSVIFYFSGNPDFISFFPGTTGNDYEFRERTSISGNTQLQFTSYKQYGTQPNSLQLQVTSALGSYDAAGIQAAQWTDITDRVTLSTGTNNTPSGVADISDLVQADQPVYIAFRKVDVATLVPNTWTINNFRMDVALPDNTLYPVTTLSSAGWAAIDLLNTAYKWTISSTSLKCTGGKTNPENEDWVISMPIYPLNVAPDKGIPIKSFSDNQLTAFGYVFNTPGVYHVVFTGSNQTVYDKKETVADITITVE